MGFNSGFKGLNQLDALISQMYSWKETLHVSDSFSVHHQEFFTVHTAMVMSYRSADSLRAGSGCSILILRVTMVDKNNAVVCCLLATSAIMLSEKKKRKGKRMKRNISCNAHLLNELLETDVP